jgi:hypothetical protein
VLWSGLLAQAFQAWESGHPTAFGPLGPLRFWGKRRPEGLGAGLAPLSQACRPVLPNQTETTTQLAALGRILGLFPDAAFRS